MTLDIINGMFETFGAISLARNCYLTHKAKEVKGVSIMTTIFFTSWGIFNIFYYPSLHQTFSFVGGILCSISNATWVGQMIYYKKFYKKLK